MYRHWYVNIDLYTMLQVLALRNAHIHTQTCTHAHTRVCTHTDTCTHTHTHTQTHTHARVHTHTFTTPHSDTQIDYFDNTCATRIVKMC